MTHPSDLVELRERLQKATGPDRDLDIAIGLASGYYTPSGGLDGEPPTKPPQFVTYIHPKYGTKWHGATGACIPELTASIDAALSLVERVLPGWQYTLYGGGEEDALCELLKDGHVKNDGEGKTLPLSILDAALTALSQLTDTGA